MGLDRSLLRRGFLVLNDRPCESVEPALSEVERVARIAPLFAKPSSGVVYSSSRKARPRVLAKATRRREFLCVRPPLFLSRLDQTLHQIQVFILSARHPDALRRLPLSPSTECFLPDFNAALFHFFCSPSIRSNVRPRPFILPSTINHQLSTFPRRAT